MAGIGFQLQKLFKEDHYSSRLKAYGFSLMVTSGPWLTIITAITLTQWLIRNTLAISFETASLFNITLAYCFIFSQVLFSIQQLVMTRYVANELFGKRYHKLFPAFLGLTKTSVLTGTVPALLFIIMSSLPFYFELLTIIFFYIMLLNWNCFLFVSALRNYKKIAWSFAIGGLIAGLGVFVLTRFVSFQTLSTVEASAYLLLPFIFGMTTTLLMIFSSVARAFEVKSCEYPLSYLQTFDKYPMFVGIGFFYTSGLWVANWVIWSGEGSSELYNFFRYHTVYDTAVFWSYLSIIPMLMYFVIAVETRFYDKYRTFYGFINKGGSLKQIETSKAQMQRVLKQMLYRMLRNQALITGLLILLAGWIGNTIHMDGEFVSIFRLTLLGAFANAGMLVFQLLLLYFEDHKGAFYTSLIFFFGILLLTFALLPLGTGGYGLSFSIGAASAFLFAGYRLTKLLQTIDAHAFQNSYPSENGKFFTIFTKRLYRRDDDTFSN